MHLFIESMLIQSLIDVLIPEKVMSDSYHDAMPE